MFKEFYREYPRKKEPLEAEKAFGQMLARGYTAEQMIDGAKKFAAECRSEGRETRYTPYPASWLRAGGFLEYDQETIVAAPIVRPARSVQEVIEFYRAAGKTVTPEILNAKSVDDLPVFARMVPNNVTPLRKASA